MHHLLPWWQPWSGRLLTLTVAMLGVWIVWKNLRRPRLDAPHCPRCRYNLTGVKSTSCPECGCACDDRDVLWRGRRRWVLATLGVIVMLTLPVHVVQNRVRQFGWSYYLRLQPMYTLLPRYRAADYRLDHGIRVTLWRDRRAWNDAEFVVTVKGEPVWRSPMDGYWTIGFDDLAGASYAEQLVDLDGNGSMELAITTNGGGTGTNDELRLLSFDSTSSPARLVNIAELSGFTTFTDDDHDGVYEIKYTSHYYRYWWSSGASSPYPIVWLTYRDGAFHFDADRTRSPLPSDDEIRAAIDFAVIDSNQPYSLAMRLAIDMIYAGHLDEGLAMIDATEPAIRWYDVDAHGPLRDDVLAAVKHAPFGEEVLALSDQTQNEK